MANLLLRLTCGKIKQLKKLGIVHFRSKERTKAIRLLCKR